MDAKKRETAWNDDWGKELDQMNLAEEEAEKPDPAETPDAAGSGEPSAQEPEKEPEGEAETPAAGEEEPKKEGEGEEAPAEEQPDTGTEALEAPSVIKFRALGAERSFDLKVKEDAEEVQRRLSLSYKVDDMTAQADERAMKKAQELQTNYFRDAGITALDPASNTLQPNPHGIVRWAITNLGPDRFQKAVTDVLGAQVVTPPGGAGGLSMADIDGLIKEAETDPNDPVYAGQLKLAKALKASAQQYQSLQSTIDQRFKQYDERFKGSDDAARKAAQDEFKTSMLKHRDDEIAKVKGLAADEDDRDWIMSKAAREEAKALQQGRTYSPDLSRECISAAVKALAAKRVATATQQARSEKQAKIEARPKPKSPAPTAGAPRPAPNAPAKKPVTREERGKAWDAQWKETMQNAG